jgi:hypothetical protein
MNNILDIKNSNNITELRPINRSQSVINDAILIYSNDKKVALKAKTNGTLYINDEQVITNSTLNLSNENILLGTPIVKNSTNNISIGNNLLGLGESISPSYNIAFGYSNVIHGKHGITIGSNNYTGNINSTDNIVIGNNLDNTIENNSIVLASYNRKNGTHAIIKATSKDTPNTCTFEFGVLDDYSQSYEGVEISYESLKTLLLANGGKLVTSLNEK